MNYLYLDESGNTGETLSKDLKFNFSDQPYYVLAGFFLNENSQKDLSTFLTSQISKHRISGNELKAKNLYDTKPRFISELIEYFRNNQIPFFIELMDKIFYLNFQLVEYFIVPYYSVPFNDANIYGKRFIASTIGKYLTQDIYQSFINTIKESSNDSLENFYEILITHFDEIKEYETKKNIEQTKADYLDLKTLDPTKALKAFLPLPDENPNKRLIHLLPNFNAFTNLIARAQKYSDNKFFIKNFEIIHDEQKQFDVIFQSALEIMKNNKTDHLTKKTIIQEKGRFDIDSNIKLNFEDSKKDIFIQVSDLLSGVVMRFWSDFINENEDKVNIYLPIIKKMHSEINYVVADHEHFKIARKF